MLSYAVIFLIIALLAGVLGFGVIAGTIPAAIRTGQVERPGGKLRLCVFAETIGIWVIARCAAMLAVIYALVVPFVLNF